MLFFAYFLVRYDAVWDVAQILSPTCFRSAQLDNVRPRALRGDSLGLPGVPRGKDGAGREAKRITFVRILNSVLSVRAGYKRLGCFAGGKWSMNSGLGVFSVAVGRL